MSNVHAENSPMLNSQPALTIVASVDQAIDVDAPIAVVSQKTKRFRFTEAYDLRLLKDVRSANGHIPEWGKTEALYEELKKTFLQAIFPAALALSQKPSSKTFADRFKRLITRRREDVKRTSRTSGIVESHGEKEVLLDDLIAEIEEREETVRAEKEEQTQQELRLVSAGQKIRNLALKRKERDGSEEGLKEEDGSKSDASSAKKRLLRSLAQSGDDLTACMLEQASQRREFEERRLVLDSERIEIEKDIALKEADRFDRVHQATNRRLDLDEKRFALEVKERKQMLEERKKMVDVMELLCKKLQ